jgi:CrcB protein
MLRLLLAIAAGGAVGAVARYGVALAALRAGATFPYGTLAVNVLGSFLLGALVRLFGAAPASGPRALELALTVGLCGGFTTFSTFGLDTVRLLETGQPAHAALYVAASVALSLLALWAGLALASVAGGAAPRV